MKGTDKFLIAIVAGAILLIVVVFALTLLQFNKPNYQPDAEPEGIVHNYLLALQLGEYERAYSYLSPDLRGYPPSVQRFTIDIEDDSWSFRGLKDDISLAVEAVKIIGNQAMVSVRQTSFYDGGLFYSGQYTSNFDVTLCLENGTWKIIKSDRYWDSCWHRPYGYGCP